MERKLPTCGEIERDLSQKIQKLYREQLGHCPRKVTCKLFDNRLAIIIEDSLITLQKTLIEEDDQSEIARHVSLAVDNVIKSRLKIAIEEVLEIEVYDILFDSSLKSHSAGAIVTLSQSPSLRKRDLIPKVHKSHYKNKSDKSIKDESIQTDTNSL